MKARIVRRLVEEDETLTNQEQDDAETVQSTENAENADVNTAEQNQDGQLKRVGSVFDANGIPKSRVNKNRSKYIQNVKDRSEFEKTYGDAWKRAETNKANDGESQEGQEQKVKEEAVDALSDWASKEFKDMLISEHAKAKKFIAKNIAAGKDYRKDISAALDRAYAGAVKEYVKAANQVAVARKKGKKKSLKDGIFKFASNPLFISLPGTGKSTVTKIWAENRGFRLEELQLSTIAPDAIGELQRPVDLQRWDENERKFVIVRKAVGYKSDLLDVLVNKPGDHQKIILFLDEVNMGDEDVKNKFYSIVLNHYAKIADEDKEFPDLLFTVGAMNPYKEGSPEGAKYGLTPALKQRFKDYDFTPSNDSSLEFMPDEFEEQAIIWNDSAAEYKEKKNDPDATPEEQEANNDKYIDALATAMEYYRKAELVKRILGSQRFSYTTTKDYWKRMQAKEDNEDIESQDPMDPQNWNGKTVEPRNFESAIDESDGTPEGLKDVWDDYCDNQMWPTVWECIKDMPDEAADKANAYLKRKIGKGQLTDAGKETLDDIMKSLMGGID